VQRHDVIVLGGGPAGAAAAIALAGEGRSVALFSRERRASPPIGETVPPAIMRPLARLGLWPAFLAAGHRQSPGTVVMWGSDTPYENEFIVNPYGMGWHLDRQRFDDMLLGAARDAGAEVHEGARIVDCRRDDRGADWIVGADANHALAPWMIDATGRASWLARRHGSKRQALDRLVALVRFGSLDSTDDRTFIEARPEGWWYAAGLPGNRVALAFFTDADLLVPDHARLWDRLVEDTALIRGVVARLGELSSVHVAGASSEYLPHFTGPGWIAVGDAALAYDPCSGQGITKALESALAAAQAIEAHHAGDSHAMHRYGEAVTEALRNFIDSRRLHYRREARWQDAVFWQRRHC
jgi:flavin-dependent dehydrogenase